MHTCGQCSDSSIEVLVCAQVLVSGGTPILSVIMAWLLTVYIPGTAVVLAQGFVDTLDEAMDQLMRDEYLCMEWSLHFIAFPVDVVED